MSYIDPDRITADDLDEHVYDGLGSGRSAEFAHGHNSARPDTGLSGNYSPPKEQWDKEALRTVEMERLHQLTSDKDY